LWYYHYVYNIESQIFFNLALLIIWHYYFAIDCQHVLDWPIKKLITSRSAVSAILEVTTQGASETPFLIKMHQNISLSSLRIFEMLKYPHNDTFSPD